MNCPICKFSELTENMSICPNCNADLDLLNDVKLVSKKIKTDKINFILVLIALIIFIFISFFTFYKYNKNVNSNENDKIVEKLKQENITLKNTIAENNKKLEINAQSISKNLNTVEKKDSTTYIVQKDDNLWTIAQKFYGDGFKFKEIANDNNIKKPSEIIEGTKLIINKNKK